MEGRQEDEVGDEPEQHRRQQLPLPQQQPVVSCHAAVEMGTKTLDPEDDGEQRGRIQIDTADEQQHQLQQQ